MLPHQTLCIVGWDRVAVHQGVGHDQTSVQYHRTLVDCRVTSGPPKNDADPSYQELMGAHPALGSFTSNTKSRIQDPHRTAGKREFISVLFDQCPCQGYGIACGTAVLCTLSAACSRELIERESEQQGAQLGLRVGQTLQSSNTVTGVSEQRVPRIATCGLLNGT
jgi:hypothetical protein